MPLEDGVLLGNPGLDDNRSRLEIELDDAIDTPLKFYSTGMRARLAFSIAAFMESVIESA